MADFRLLDKKVRLVLVEGWTYEVGKDGVTSIHEHQAAGEGDRWFYDVHYSDGRVSRLHAFLLAEFEPEQQ